MARPRKFADDHVVLDRAIDLYWRCGADSVSIRDLEEALELRAPSIYRRFHSKDELLVRCLDRYVDRVILGRIRHLLDDADDPLDGIREFFTSVLLTRPGERDPRGCLVTTTAGHAEAATPEVQRALARGFAAIDTAFERQVARAVATGQLPADTDTAALASALSLVFQGLLVLVRTGTDDLAPTIDSALAVVVPTQ